MEAKMQVEDFQVEKQSAALPRWETEKSAICEKIANHKAPLKIVLKTKNEPERLEAWIDHHAAIAGLENLIIFDNMSSSPPVLEIYKKYLGSFPIILFAQFHNMIHHTGYYAELYAALKASCTFFSFLDTDEYMALYDGQNKFHFGQDVLDFFMDRRSVDIFPGTWLSNLRGSSDRFVLSQRTKALSDGLKWGKPVISASMNLSQYVQHNAQIDHSLYPSNLTTNLFILHRHCVTAQERINVNLQKLIAYGALKPGQGIAEVLAFDVATLSPPNVKLYCSQIQSLVQVKDEKVASTGGTFKILADGEIEWRHEWQRVEMQEFVRDPTRFTGGLYA